LRSPMGRFLGFWVAQTTKKRPFGGVDSTDNGRPSQ
jgi:hypothetical protein